MPVCTCGMFLSSLLSNASWQGLKWTQEEKSLHIYMSLSLFFPKYFDHAAAEELLNY